MKKLVIEYTNLYIEDRLKMMKLTEEFLLTNNIKYNSDKNIYTIALDLTDKKTQAFCETIMNMKKKVGIRGIIR